MFWYKQFGQVFGTRIGKMSVFAMTTILSRTWRQSDKCWKWCISKLGVRGITGNILNASKTDYLEGGVEFCFVLSGALFNSEKTRIMAPASGEKMTCLAVLTDTTTERDEQTDWTPVVRSCSAFASSRAKKSNFTVSRLCRRYCLINVALPSWRM